MNLIGLQAVFVKEITRTKKVMIQAVLSPIISTVLYFVVFGAAIGKNVTMEGNISYGAFIVPGLIMMSLIMNSFMSASSGLYFPRFIGTVVDYLTAPLSYLEITLGFSLAAVVRSLFIGFLIYLSALFFVSVPVAHPFFTLFFAFLTSLTFAFFGCALGLWARDFEQLSLIPTLVITPLSFLGGIFYSPNMLPPVWQTLTLLNPIYYMIEGLRFGFFDTASISPLISTLAVSSLLLVSTVMLEHIFRSGKNLRN